MRSEESDCSRRSERVPWTRTRIFEHVDVVWKVLSLIVGRWWNFDVVHGVEWAAGSTTPTSWKAS
jgi:hypothetical protein